MRVCTLDFETDPFRAGRVPRPFACEIYGNGICEVWWGDNCVERFLAWLNDYSEPLLIYAHNGGKFDFHFLLRHIENPIRVIKTRIVSARIGRHELRDSFAILPVPLAQMQKGSIDYALLERDKRNKHKAAILDYLHKDCFYLWQYVTAFLARFGNILTIGAAALKRLQADCPFRRQGSAHDAQFRPYYRGGRVEAFQPAGVYPGAWKLYDVNSMYPHAMARYVHPINGAFSSRTKPPTDGRPYFAEIEATSRGALPLTDETGRLVFPHGRAVFLATGHEIEEALALGRLDVHAWRAVWASDEWRDFGDFVFPLYAEKAAHKASGAKADELFAKLLLNSAYGKTATRPDDFKEWQINTDYGRLPPPGWDIAADLQGVELWSAPAAIKERMYCDVAIGASITGAARATLLRGLHHASRPIYCDTDSIVCDALEMPLDKYELGAWDLEAEGDRFAVAGKKLYALTRGGETIKIASKGGRLTAEQVEAVARGDVVPYENDAPTFGLKDRKAGRVHFTQRKFASTIDSATPI